MKLKTTILLLLLATVTTFAQQGFFLEDSWEEKTSVIPPNESATKTTATPTVNVSVDFSTKVTKVSPYLFGHCVSQSYTNYYTTDYLLDNIESLSPNILRYPGGSGSNYFYWNRTKDDGHPDDVSVTKFKYGISDDPEYMSNEAFYTLCDTLDVSGMNVVNYSYARFGTSKDPVAVAAHLAADWVRYDNGRTKYWEIGNENYGAWEEGYEIDTTQNQDGQPAIQTGTLYGEHFHVFADSMRKAAQEIGVEIKLGAVCYHDNEDPWNHEVISEVGNNTDFLIVHKYLGQKRIDADYEELLNVAHEINLPYEVLASKVAELGLDPIPVALTEWNTNYEISGQKVSYLSGMFNTIAMGTIIESGYGMASRWNLVWRYNDALTHGLINGNKDSEDEGLGDFLPRPAFYYLYYFQQFFGDRMVTCTSDNDTVVSFASSYADGNSSVILVNKSTEPQTVKVDFANFTQGDKYYWYLLTGDTDDGSFSRKVYVNGQNSETVSGPLNYEEIEAYACDQDGGILIDLPALSTVYALVEGNNTSGISDTEMLDGIKVISHPKSSDVRIELDLNASSNVGLSIYDVTGRKVQDIFRGQRTAGQHTFLWNKPSSVGSFYLLKVEVDDKVYTHKILVA